MPTSSGHNFKAVKLAKWFGALGIFLTLSLVFLLRPRAPVSFPVPTPNGYDQFLRAGAAIHAALDSNTRLREIFAKELNQTSPQELELLVSANVDAVRLVQEGLNMRCRVPVQVSKEYVAEGNTNRSRLRGLTNFMIKRAWLAQIKGRTQDALEAYLEAYRLAHEFGSGGLFVDFLLQLGDERHVLACVNSLVPSLNSAQCEEALRVLGGTESDRENVEAVIKRDRVWVNATFNASYLARARMRRWREAIIVAVKTRSLAGLRDSDSQRLVKAWEHHQEGIAIVRQKLRQQRDQAAAR